jgi:hypothetical protein
VRKKSNEMKEKKEDGEIEFDVGLHVKMNLMIINDDISIKGTSINLRSNRWLDLFSGLRICEWKKNRFKKVVMSSNSFYLFTT